MLVESRVFRRPLEQELVARGVRMTHQRRLLVQIIQSIYSLYGCPRGAETQLEFGAWVRGVGRLGGRGSAAMTDAELVPSCPFPSVVPVCKRPMSWWQFAARAASSTPLQRVLFIPPPGRAASHSTY